MKIIGRTIALLLMLVILPLFTAATCNFAVYQTLRSPDTYRNAFDNPALFEDVIPLALPAIINAARTHEKGTEFDLGELPFEMRDVMRTLSPEAWGEATSQIITAEWLQQQVATFVELILHVTDGDFTMLDETLNMQDLKARLEGEPAKEVARLIIDSAPPCNESQLAMLNDTSVNKTIPICLPPTKELKSQSVQSIVKTLGDISASLPEELTVGDFFGMSQDEARFIYLLARLDGHMMSLTYLCPMGLLALMVFVTIRSFKGLGRWIGTTTLLTAVMVIITIVLVQVVAIGIITESTRAQSDLEQFVAQLFTAVLRSVSSSITTLMLLQAGIFGAIGFILLALSFVLRSPNDDLPSGTFLITDDGQIISTASLPTMGNSLTMPVSTSTPPPAKR